MKELIFTVFILIFEFFAILVAASTIAAVRNTQREYNGGKLNKFNRFNNKYRKQKIFS